VLTPMERKVCGRISSRAGALLDDLRLHVGLPTGGDNRAALDESRGRLIERLERLGAITEMVPGDPKPEWLYGVERDGYVPPTAVCRRTGQSGSAKILVAGHLDTVHDPRGSFRELAVSPDGRTAVGPGCVDMKGGLVILAGALEVLAEAGATVSWTVLLNSDEETGSYCSERAIRAESRRHDVGLAVEPAMPGGELAVERLGSGQFMIECRGRAAHVGRDFEHGVSAVTALAERVVAASRLCDPSRGRILNIGPILGGTATNVVPDVARAWGNVRFPDGRIADELRAGLDALGTGPEALPSAVVRTSFVRAAKPMTEGTRRLAELAREAAEALGQRLPFGKTGGVCDGNIMQDEGLPTIDTLGVRGGGLHTSAEWIELASLVERCQLLAVLMMRLSSGQDREFTARE
jgi:glutamate carboxypeptidase